jgi:hypothetical protein
MMPRKFQVGLRFGTSVVAAAGLLGAGAVMAVERPDFSGVWERDPPLHAPGLSANEVFGAGAVAESGRLNGGEPQLREPYATRYRRYQEKKRQTESAGKANLDASIQCLPQGVPMLMMAILPLEIMQSRTKLLILAEELAQTRRVYIGEKMPPLEEIPPGYFGFSVAQWQGDTLVVRTQGIREDVQFLDMPHSSAMSVTERLRLTGNHRLEDQITVDDPTVLVRPYSLTYHYKLNPAYKVGEYVCDHNHYTPDGQGGVNFDATPVQK